MPTLFKRYVVNCSLSLAMICLTSLPVFADSYTFQTLDVPGAKDTSLTGINNSGQIIGTYTNSSETFGFLDSGGSFTNLMAGGASLTPTGVNNLGQVVGNDASGSYLYSRGAYTKISDPPNPITSGPASMFPVSLISVLGVNDTGQLLETASGPGFNGVATLIVTGNSSAFASINSDAFVSGFNNAGDFVGTVLIYREFLDAGFLQTSGSFQTILPPGSLSQTHAEAVNNSDQVVAWDSSGDGLLYQDGMVTILDYPGAYSTQLLGINDAGDIVGTYTDSEGGLSQGFVATPEGNPAVPEPSSLLLLILGMPLMALVSAQRRFAGASFLTAVVRNQLLPATSLARSNFETSRGRA